MFGFIAFSWDRLDDTARSAAEVFAQRLRTAPTPWQRVLEAPGLQVFCKGIRAGSNEPHRLHGNAGVVLGALFTRPRDPLDDAPAPLARLDERQSEAIMASRGEQLITAYLGRYVAFLRHAETPTQWVLRSPTGNLPCFLSCHGGVSIFFSQVSDLALLQLKGWRIDEAALRTRVASGMLHAGNLLENLSEVYGGECIELHGDGMKRRFYWKPLDIADTDPIEDANYAIRVVRAAVKSSVQGWASCYSSIIVRASGGLDSSIIAGCLRDAPSAPRISLFTLYIPEDLRNTLPWSRTIAEHVGVKPVEFARPPNIHWSALARLPLRPWPECDTAVLDIAFRESELARETGASAVMTGDGGDSLFGSRSAKFAAREFLRRHGMSWRLLKVAENVALLRRITVWKVLGDALRTRLFGEAHGLEDPLAGRELVDDAVMRSFVAERDYVPHPWYRGVPPAELNWAAIMRLGTLMQLPSLYSPVQGADGANLEYVLPLYDQRVVEWSLRTAAYMHITDGRDRDLARRAFVDIVPDRILKRHWKDFPTGVLEGMVKTNLLWTRELLLDGVLVKLGLLDRQRIEANLNPKTLKSNVSGGELFDHVSTECWARSVQAAWRAGA